MTRQRAALYVLLIAVAGAAAVLSFAALRDLALVCGFAPELAWLLPVTVDAGAAAGSLVWLGRWSAAGADRYARALALTLLAGSVAGNALGHGLEAYSARPHWLVVVGVSAIAPTVLGALVHLVVLVGRPETDQDPILWMEDEAAALLAARDQLLAEADDDEADQEPTPADRPDVDPPMTDEEILAEVREWAVDLGRPPSRDEMLARYRIGAPRCGRLRRTLGWAGLPTAAGREPTEVTP